KYKNSVIYTSGMYDILTLSSPSLQSLCRAQNHGGQLSAPRGSKAMLERKQFCQWPCKCRVKPQCAPGFSSVLDSCGCCKSCAQQIREACNERDICDPHKGMYCNFSKDQLRYEAGVCAYLMAVGCDLNGVHYENGEAFQPRSMYKCTCTIVYTLAFIPWPAVLLGPAPLRSNTSRKHQQDTTYMADSSHLVLMFLILPLHNSNTVCLQSLNSNHTNRQLKLSWHHGLPKDLSPTGLSNSL
uniref:IGFBP N-terminal domain-containing protein n=1 Tax=Oncorhynchus tshawytscha TaxID=74940 RepID=A0A8C8LSJ4_ONCTS